uniref:Conserved oligomeric Golgi complex subunit 4 n=1 Tax=Trichobilharzia regenti TaxID=157069 RepID=A0AA85JYR6_TRIRE|nr:unnamed protein product [Trichobilharzia regenti]
MDSSVCTVNSLSELNDLVEKSNCAKVNVSNEIKDILARRTQIEENLKKINSLIPDFHKLQLNAENSSKLVGCASELALQLSGKVEQLDFVKNHVLKCVEKLNHVITLKNSALGVKRCLLDSKLDEAASYVYTYLGMEKDVLSLVMRLVADDPDNNPLTTLDECQKVLVKKAINQFDEYATQRDEKNIVNLLKIFFLLGETNEGIQRFAGYLCTNITGKCETLLTFHKASTSSSTSESPGFVWANLITEMLEFVADTLKNNAIYVETYCGPGNVFNLVASVQSVVDKYVQCVIERYLYHHRLDELCSMTKKSNTMNYLNSKRSDTSIQSSHKEKLLDSNSSSQLSSNDQGLDKILTIEPIIVEMLQMITCSELYLRFIHRRILGDVKQCNLSENDYKLKVNEISQFFNNCQIIRQVQDLLGKYLILEEYYLRVTITKALNSDEIDKSGNVWGFIDDVFFITKKSLSRSFQSGNVDSICAMVNHSCSILTDRMVNDTLANSVRAGFPSGWVQDAYSYVQNSVAAAGGTLSSTGSAVNVPTISSAFNNVVGGSNSLARYHFLISINSIEACQKNLQALVNHLEKELTSVYQNQENNFQKLHMCITELNMSIGEQLQRLLDSAFDHLSTAVVQSQVKSLLSGFKSLKYDLLEEDLDVLAANDPWIESCIAHTEDFLKPFRSVLSTENNDKLVLILINEILRQVDQLIQRKSFSRFGAVQLEKEFRSLFSYLTSISYTPLRDYFTRSLQICRLLNLDRIDEVHYYWNSSNWRLTAQEVRSILSLRRDFPVNEIRALKLQ